MELGMIVTFSPFSQDDLKNAMLHREISCRSPKKKAATLWVNDIATSWGNEALEVQLGLGRCHFPFPVSVTLCQF